MNVEALKTDRAEFTRLRNKVRAMPVKNRLTILVNNLDILIRDPGDEPCAAAYRRNRTSLATFMAGRA